MTTFAFTHTQDVKSKAVDTLTYNERTGELVIDWHNDLYKYSGVPKNTFDQVLAGTYKNGLTDASVGRAAQRVKKDFGPGDYLGRFGEVKFVPAGSATAVAPKPTQAKATLHTSAPSVSPTFSLTPSPSVNVGSESSTTYTIDFVPAGTDEPREYTPEGVNSVEDALKALEEVANMLGVALTVKGVYVNFE
jgi:hypothetical protein